MVEIDTRVFGKIGIEEDKIITFERGILGFPDLRDFTLIFDIDKGEEANIKWLQSIQEPAFAMPVMNPELVMPGYEPVFPEEQLKALGETFEEDNLVLLVTVTVPADITKTTVNLKAPIIINSNTRKAVQLISDNESFSVKHAIYEGLMAKQQQN